MTPDQIAAIQIENAMLRGANHQFAAAIAGLKAVLWSGDSNRIWGEAYAVCRLLSPDDAAKALQGVPQ